MLNKGKTLGSVQPVGSVSLVSDDATSHSTPSQSSPLLTLDDVLDFTRAVLEGAEVSAEQVSDCCELILEDTDRFVGLDGWMGQTDWAEHGIDEQGSSSVKRFHLPNKKLLTNNSTKCYSRVSENQNWDWWVAWRVDHWGPFWVAAIRPCPEKSNQLARDSYTKPFGGVKIWSQG